MAYAKQRDGTAVVIKLIQSGSNELSLLQYLSSITSPSNHAIPLLATFQLSLGTFIVIPEATTLTLGFKFGDFQGKVADLSQQLVDGVAFLHDNGIAHLDIKPGNIVVTRRSHLYIIDFDISVRIDCPGELIDEWLGTPGWMAPEIGEEHGPRHLYDPIRADLWSCGLLLQYLATNRGEEADAFQTLTAQLLNRQPLLRPMLSLWRRPIKAKPVLTSQDPELEQLRSAKRLRVSGPSKATRQMWHTHHHGTAISV